MLDDEEISEHTLKRVWISGSESAELLRAKAEADWELRQQELQQRQKNVLSNEMLNKMLQVIISEIT